MLFGEICAVRGTLRRSSSAVCLRLSTKSRTSPLTRLHPSSPRCRHLHALPPSKQEQLLIRRPLDSGLRIQRPDPLEPRANEQPPSPTLSASSGHRLRQDGGSKPWKTSVDVPEPDKIRGPRQRAAAGQITPRTPEHTVASRQEIEESRGARRTTEAYGKEQQQQQQQQRAPGVPSQTADASSVGAESRGGPSPGTGQGWMASKPIATAAGDGRPLHTNDEYPAYKPAAPVVVDKPSSPVVKRRALRLHRVGSSLKQPRTPPGSGTSKRSSLTGSTVAPADTSMDSQKSLQTFNPFVHEKAPSGPTGLEGTSPWRVDEFPTWNTGRDMTEAAPAMASSSQGHRTRTVDWRTSSGRGRSFGAHRGQNGDAGPPSAGRMRNESDNSPLARERRVAGLPAIHRVESENAAYKEIDETRSYGRARRVESDGTRNPSEEYESRPWLSLDRSGAERPRRERDAGQAAGRTYSDEMLPPASDRTAGRSLDDPRGRGRDKLRRRQQFVTEDEGGSRHHETVDRAEMKRHRKKERRVGGERSSTAAIPVLIPEFISVDNLAKLLKVRTEQFSQMLQSLGFDDLPYDHVLNGETAGLIAMEYNYTPMMDESGTRDLRARPAAEDASRLPPRPPVVTIMGHVDHGKTTILDWLRRSSVAAGEHGGITQHIGAFSVAMPSGKTITFLDTPGHSAFLSMRQRGAGVTDIVVLVVAADDSVKPQTIEAIRHAKAAGVPMVVAVNKIDKEEADVERVKQDLARHDVEVEDFGGDTQVVPLSGKTGAGMADLEESLVTLSEILDMRAEVDGPVEGWVIEGTTKRAGRVATVLVKRGTVRPGDIVVAGTTWAKIRTLKDEAGVEIASAGPGTPVEIDGWRQQPVAGDEVLEAADEGAAKEVLDFRHERLAKLKMAEDMEAVNESRRIEQEKRDREEAAEAAKRLGEVPAADEAQVPTSETRPGMKEVYFIVKGDVSGSVEAVLNSVTALGNEEVRAQVLRSGVGPVAEFDIEHAAAARGHVIAFNTPLDGQMRRMAEASGVGVIEGNVIYRLIDEVKARLSEQLAPLVTQRVTGEAEVAQIFDINIKGRIKKPYAGCKVRNGVIARSSRVRVLRRKAIVYDGTLSSLKFVKKDVTEMRKGSECGMGFDEWDDFQPGDQVQCYDETREKRTL